MCRLRFSALLVLCSVLSSAGATCTLPAALQTSTWEYTGGPNTPQTLTFGPSSMSGLVLAGRGTTLNRYDCISNVDNVFVFRSTNSYSDRGQNRYVFMCMRLTPVSDNLFYFYLLSDTDSSNNVIPYERVFNPPGDNIPSDSNPTCSFCNYTAGPPDDDVRTLRRSGTSESLPYGITACLPCGTRCIATYPMLSIYSTKVPPIPHKRVIKSSAIREAHCPAVRCVKETSIPTTKKLSMLQREPIKLAEEDDNQVVTETSNMLQREQIEFIKEVSIPSTTKTLSMIKRPMFTVK